MDWKGAHYSGYGGQPTNFINQPQAHFQNGVFQGVKFDIRPPGSPGGPTLQPPNSSSPWTTVSVLDATATFDDPTLGPLADPKRNVTKHVAPEILIDFSSITTGKAYKLKVDVTFTDDTSIDTIEVNVTATATATDIRLAVANALNSLTTVKAGIVTDNAHPNLAKMTVTGNGGKELQSLSVRSTVEGYAGPQEVLNTGGVGLSNTRIE